MGFQKDTKTDCFGVRDLLEELVVAYTDNHMKRVPTHKALGLLL